MYRVNRAFIAIAASLMLSGCALLPEEEVASSVTVVDDDNQNSYTLETVLRRDIDLHTMIYASYTFVGGRDYSFDGAGRVTGIYVEEGDAVNVGDMLATLSSYDSYNSQYTQYTQRLESLESELEAKRQESTKAYEELEIYHKYGEVTDRDYVLTLRQYADDYDDEIAEMEDEITILKLRIEQAKAGLAGSVIYAENSGIVSYAMNLGNSGYDWQTGRSRGKYVDENTTVVSIGQSSDRGFVSFETQYTDYFEIGQELTLSSISGSSYAVTVNNIDGGVIYFGMDYADSTLTSGATVSYVLTMEKREGVLSISKNALHTMEDEYYVYYVDENGLRQMKKVEVGLIGNSHVEIISGLTEGEQIIR
ncbi:MAG: efflux RND transporter periplasmic adaptor subunit [Lachnospiraceae bacterium]|nr:efflux RND transporter periplasmic adaptor subunit [Lachnospiraceae bacterium]